MNEKLRRKLAKMEREADREREAAGLMSKRKLAAILYSNPELLRAVMGTAAPSRDPKKAEEKRMQEGGTGY